MVSVAAGGNRPTLLRQSPVPLLRAHGTGLYWIVMFPTGDYLYRRGRYPTPGPGEIHSTRGTVPYRDRTIMQPCRPTKLTERLGGGGNPMSSRQWKQPTASPLPPSGCWAGPGEVWVSTESSPHGQKTIHRPRQKERPAGDSPTDSSPAFTSFPGRLPCGQPCGEATVPALDLDVVADLR